MMVLFVFAMVAVGCQERVVIGDNGQLPATDAGADQAEAEADVGSDAEAPTDADAQAEAEADAQVETSTDAQPDAEADAPIDTAVSLKTCTVQNTANLGVADPVFLETVGGQGFGFGLCPAAGSACVLKTLSFQGDLTGNIDMPNSDGSFGLIPFGSPDGYLVTYAAKTGGYRAGRVVNNTLTVDYEDPSNPVGTMAALDSGGYWIGQSSVDFTYNSSTVFIRYVAPTGQIGSSLILTTSQYPGVQNGLAGIATIGQVVGAAVNAVDKTGLQTTSAFLRQEDGTIKRVDLDTFQTGGATTSYAYGMTTLGGRFAVKWTSVDNTTWTGHLTFMDPDGTNLSTVDMSTEQMITTIGENIAAVEYDQVMLKTVLRIYDDKMQPVTEPLIVVKDIKGYYMNFPRARGNSLDSIMVAYTETQPDTTFAIKAAIISCQ
ncbi:MAG: hypothetical protein ACYC44_02535 [Patescibacteria group bacterium]